MELAKIADDIAERAKKSAYLPGKPSWQSLRWYCDTALREYCDKRTASELDGTQLDILTNMVAKRFLTRGL